MRYAGIQLVFIAFVRRLEMRAFVVFVYFLHNRLKLGRNNNTNQGIKPQTPIKYSNKKNNIFRNIKFEKKSLNGIRNPSDQ